MTGILSKSTVMVTTIQGSVNIQEVGNNFKVSTDGGCVTLTVEGTDYVLRSYKHLNEGFLEAEANRLAEALVNYGEIPILMSRGVEIVSVFSDIIKLGSGDNALSFDSLAELLDFLSELNGVHLR